MAMAAQPVPASLTVLPPRRVSTWRSLRSNPKAAAGMAIVLFFVAIAVFGPLLAPYSPTAMGFLPNQPPTWAHPLGTNQMGEDLWSQFLYGTRLSLLVGLGAGAIATFLSIFVGMVAGYAGGVVDDVLSVIMNIFLVIPGLVLAIVLASYSPYHGVLPVMVVLAITGWAWGARSLRSQVLSLKQRDFVIAATLSGESTLSVVFRHIFPNMVSIAASSFLFTTIYAVLGEAGLEFLGLGNVQTVTWGTILYWAGNNNALLTGVWWWVVPPGLAIALFGMGLALLNYGIDEITNPRLRGRRGV
jgi:peptide/nickel transport system permease protein